MSQLRRDVTTDPTDDTCAKERFGGTALPITPCPFVSGDRRITASRSMRTRLLPTQSVAW